MKKGLLCVMLAMFAFSMTLPFPEQGSAAPKEDCATVSMFNGAHFVGWEWRRCVDTEGYWTIERLNNNASSIIVREGKCVRVWDKEHYRGRSAVFCGTVPTLPPEWNNQIESIKYEPRP